MKGELDSNDSFYLNHYVGKMNRNDSFYVGTSFVSYTLRNVRISFTNYLDVKWIGLPNLYLDAV